MYRFTGFSLAASLTISMAASASDSAVDQYVKTYLTGQPVAEFTSFVDADGAYDFQQQIGKAFEARGYKPVGFKLALTSTPRLFDAPDPLYGQLYNFMRRENGAEIGLKEFTRPLLELELAVRIGKDVAPPFTPKQLREAISGVAPAVELADMVFANPRALSWQQLAATGAGARRFIIGTPKPLDEAPLGDQQAEARWNGELYSRGYSRNIDGGQLQALTFLAAQLNHQGLQLQKGDWVLTGAMNRMLPAKAGEYRVDFGDLGQLSFTLTP